MINNGWLKHFVPHFDKSSEKVNCLYTELPLFVEGVVMGYCVCLAYFIKHTLTLDIRLIGIEYFPIYLVERHDMCSLQHKTESCSTYKLLSADFTFLTFVQQGKVIQTNDS